MDARRCLACALIVLVAIGCRHAARKGTPPAPKPAVSAMQSTGDPPRLTFECHRADVADVANLLAQQGGARIVIDGDVHGEVSMRFTDVDRKRALKLVVRQAGCFVFEEDDGRTLHVVDRSKLEALSETRVFRFKYIRPDAYYRTSDGWTACIPMFTDVFFTARKLLDVLREMSNVPPDTRGNTATFSYSPDQKCLLVRDTRFVLDQMAQLIRKLDVEPAK